MLAAVALLNTLNARADPLYDEPIAPTAACAGWFRNTLPGQPSSCARTCAYVFNDDTLRERFKRCSKYHKVKPHLRGPEHELVVRYTPPKFRIQNNVCKILHRGMQDSSNSSPAYKYELYGNNFSSYGKYDRLCYPWVNFKKFQCLCVLGPKMAVPTPGSIGSADQSEAIGCNLRSTKLKGILEESQSCDPK